MSGVAGMSGAAAVSLLVAVAVAAVTYAVLAARHSHVQLPEALGPYSVEDAASASSGRPFTLVENGVVLRAVDVTAAVAARLRVLPYLERLLEEAAVQARAAEILFVQVAAAAVLVVTAWAVPRVTALPVLALVVVAAGPVLGLRLAIRRRRRAFATGLPEALRMLANSLRTGRSFLQGLQAVAREADEPMATELGRVVAQARLGRAMEDALDEVMHRMDSADGVLVVAAVRMQRRIGGNLAELLSNVADAIVARDRLRGEVRALTAEGRISAIVLAVLPVALALVMGLVNPSYLSVLFHDPLGQAMVACSTVLAVLGFLWMRKAMDVGV